MSSGRQRDSRRSRRSLLRPYSQNDDDEFLTFVTVFPTDEEERTRTVKLELSVSIFKFLNWVFGVTVLVIVLVHHQNRVRPFLVLKILKNKTKQVRKKYLKKKKKRKFICKLTESVIDLESVSSSPVVVVLRRVHNPALFSSYVEFVGLRTRCKARK